MQNYIEKAHRAMEVIDWHSILEYDESFETCLKWIEPTRIGKGGLPVKRIRGGMAGGKSSNNNYQINYRKLNYRVSKIIWIMFNHKIPEGYCVDYLDGDSFNVKIGNLIVTPRKHELSDKYCEDLRKYIAYDESMESCLRVVGKFGQGSTASIGDYAGYLDKSDGYYKLHSFGYRYKVHRVVWYLHFGKIPDGYWIDHINGVRSDNRIENLRLVEPEFNCRNRYMNKNNNTGHAMVAYSEFFNQRGTLIQRYVASVSFGTKGRTRSFSCVKYGRDNALRLAVEWRDAELARVNAQGAGYTERHGEQRPTE